MSKDDRSERLNIRISPAEVAKLNELAEEAGLSSSDIVRMLIRREHTARFGKETPDAPKA